VISRLLPARLDNDYRGSKAAIILFAVVVSMKTLQALLAMFMGAAVVPSADGVPIGSYAPDAAQTILTLFALFGLARLTVLSVCLLVLVRYRGAIPLMFAVLGLEYIGRQVILNVMAMPVVGSPKAPLVNIILFALTVIGFVLSLRMGKSGSG
jgi:hypothetical protein